MGYLSCTCSNHMRFYTITAQTRSHQILNFTDCRHSCCCTMILNNCFHNNHNTALFIWHDFNSEIYTVQLIIRSLVVLTIMPGIECSIVITYQYYENCLYCATLQVSRRIYSDWFLVSRLNLMWLAIVTQITHVRLIWPTHFCSFL